MPLTVAPSAPDVRFWLDGQATFDGAPLELTLSDGGRWVREPVPPRPDYAFGLGAGRLSVALQFSSGTFGLAGQWDVVHLADRLLGLAVAARVSLGGGYDLSIIPVVATRVALSGWADLAPFGALRLRWGETLYDVQGWSAELTSPYATVLTRDLALAPMVGAALATRYAELRLTAGWEFLLVDRVVWEARPADTYRSSGPFACLALRLQLGSRP